MAVDPDIRAATRTADAGHAGIVFEMRVPENLSYCEGHFPGCALLPGVVQINWAIEFARKHLGVDGAFRGVSALKFMRVIQPGDEIALALSFNSKTGQLKFEYRRASGACASGVAQFSA